MGLLERLGLGEGLRKGSSGKAGWEAATGSLGNPRTAMEEGLQGVYGWRRTWRKASAWKSGKRLKKKRRKRNGKWGDLEGSKRKRFGWISQEGKGMGG